MQLCAHARLEEHQADRTLAIGGLTVLVDAHVRMKPLRRFHEERRGPDVQSAVARERHHPAVHPGYASAVRIASRRTATDAAVGSAISSSARARSEEHTSELQSRLQI